MAEVDLRAILTAFAEKGWVLYESLQNVQLSPHPRDHLLGPVDNLKYGIKYRIVPSADNPADMDNVWAEISMASRDNMCFYVTEDGTRICINTVMLEREASGTFSPFELENPEITAEDLEKAVRENIMPYDRQSARRQNAGS